MDEKISRTKKGKIEFERSKKANEFFKQGNTSDMFKTMFGQEVDSYDMQVELGINSSKFEYVYDENEGRRVITQTEKVKHLQLLLVVVDIENLKYMCHLYNGVSLHL